MVTAANRNPPWLAAMLAQMYPGGSADTGTGGTMGTGTPPSPWNQPMPNPPQGTGGRVPEMMTPMQGPEPRFFPPPSSAIANTRNAAAPPRPNPANVGGAPSPGIPAPVGANRTANNPNYSLVQYNAGGNARGGNAPIYTAANFGGPQNAGWGQLGQNPGVQSRQPQPQGALANPQGGGSGFDVGKLFAGLPSNTFDDGQGAAPSGQSGGPMSDEAVANLAQNHPGNMNMSPDQLQTYMNTQPWVQNMGRGAGGNIDWSLFG